MSTIINSSDEKNNLNQNTFSKNFIANEHQQIDSGLTKNFLTGHRGNIT
jgi:hypothetical protein